MRIGKYWNDQVFYYGRIAVKSLFLGNFGALRIFTFSSLVCAVAADQWWRCSTDVITSTGPI